MNWFQNYCFIEDDFSKVRNLINRKLENDSFENIKQEFIGEKEVWQFYTKHGLFQRKTSVPFHIEIEKIADYTRSFVKESPMYRIGTFLSWTKYNKSFLPTWYKFLDYRELLHDSLVEIFERGEYSGYLYQEMHSLSDSWSDFDDLESKVYRQILKEKNY